MKGILATIAALVLTSPALAQDVKIQGVEPVTPPKTYTLTLTEKDLNVIGIGIGQVPLSQALPTFQSIDRQVSEQRQRAQNAPAAPKEQPTHKDADQ